MKYSKMDFMTIHNNFFSKRRSVAAKKMMAGAISQMDLDDILSAGIRVPDHAALNPWKIIVIKGESLKRIDNEIILPEYIKDNPDAEEKNIIIESSRLQRASAVIAVISAPVEHPKIPIWEMQLSSAAVCMNLLSCAQSKGYAAQWITEWYAYNDRLLQELGGRVGLDKVSGFIYIGNKIEDPSERRRPDLIDVVKYI